MKTKDRVINIDEYIKCVKRYWYVILVCVLFFSVLASGFYIYRHNTKETVNAEIGIEEAYSQLSDVEKANVSIVLNNYEDYCECVYLLNNTVIEQLDPNNVMRTGLSYKITYTDGTNNVAGTELNTPVNTAGSNLYFYCSQGGLSRDVSEDLGIEARLFEDCIVPSAYVVDTGCFSIVLYGSDIIPGMTESVKTNIEKYADNLSNTNVEFISEVSSTTRSSYIFSNQKNLEEGLATIQNRFNTSIKRLTDKELQYLELAMKDVNNETFVYLYDNSEIAANDSSDNNAFSYKGLLKYIALGVLIGIVFALMVFLARFMFSNKIVSTHDYTDLLGLTLINSVGSDLSNIDFAVLRLSVICDKNNIKRVAIISTAIEQYETIINELANRLIKRNINVSIIRDYMVEYDSYEELQQYGNCIVVEGIGRSVLKKVIKETDFCSENDVNIIGVIDIDA